MARLPILALCLVALAGCTATPNPTTPTAPAPIQHATLPVLNVTGTLWLPMTTGANMTETMVPFHLNGTADLQVTLHLGSSLTPVSAAMAMIELRDPRGAILDQAMFMPPGMDPNEQTLHAKNATAGSYELHFSTRGGSDGASHGDYVTYRIQSQQTYDSANGSQVPWKASP